MLKKVVFCAMLTMLSLASAFAQAGGAMDLNIVTFNLRFNNPADGPNAWPHRKEMVASVFPDHQVDLAGLQEALSGMVTDLQSLLPKYGWVGVGRNDGKSGGEYAPIFYNRERFTLEKSGFFWLSETPEVPGSIGWDAKHTRIATWGIFREKATRRGIFFINTHFDNKGKQARENSARLLIQRIVSLHGDLPVIMTGDLNVSPDSPSLATLTSDPAYKLTDSANLSVTPHVGGTQSSNEFKTPGPSLIIDYIFVGPGIQVKSHGYYPTIKDGVFISDHWPVVSRVTTTGK